MIYILCNPTAGGGRASEALQRLRAHLQKRGIQAQIGLSEYHGHTLELVAQAVAQGHTRIFTLGGDGTVHEAINGLANANALEQAALGFLPGGTGNDFTRNLGLSQDILEAFDALYDGEEALVDLWRANDRHFVNVFGLGLDTALDGWSRKTKKVLRGMPAYIAALMLTLVGFRFPDVTLTVDGVPMHRRVTVLTASNGRYYGGGIDVAPSARLQDGKLHLVLINRVNKLLIPMLLLKYITGRHIQEVPQCEYLTASRLTLQADGELLCETDGELALRPPVTLEPALTRLRTLVPLRWAARPEGV